MVESTTILREPHPGSGGGALGTRGGPASLRGITLLDPFPERPEAAA